jgi:hypothetical protein
VTWDGTVDSPHKCRASDGTRGRLVGNRKPPGVDRLRRAGRPDSRPSHVCRECPLLAEHFSRCPEAQSLCGPRSIFLQLHSSWSESSQRLRCPGHRVAAGTTRGGAELDQQLRHGPAGKGFLHPADGLDVRAFHCLEPRAGNVIHRVPPNVVLSCRAKAGPPLQHLACANLCVRRRAGSRLLAARTPSPAAWERVQKALYFRRCASPRQPHFLSCADLREKERGQEAGQESELVVECCSTAAANASFTMPAISSGFMPVAGKSWPIRID